MTTAIDFKCIVSMFRNTLYALKLIQLRTNEIKAAWFLVSRLVIFLIYFNSSLKEKVTIKKSIDII